MLEPIERHIVDQLQARPRVPAWHRGTQQEEIARIIVDAVAKEKFTDEPAIHPEDPLNSCSGTPTMT